MQHLEASADAYQAISVHKDLLDWIDLGRDPELYLDRQLMEQTRILNQQSKGKLKALEVCYEMNMDRTKHPDRSWNKLLLMIDNSR